MYIICSNVIYTIGAIVQCTLCIFPRARFGPPESAPLGGAIMRSNSNARNAIPPQSCSFKRECLITSSRESI